MSKEKYKEAKKFVLQNCYDYVYKSSNGEFYKEPLFDSEVCPFAFKSYLKYPFFNPVNKSGYNIFYYWQPDRNGEKGRYNSKELSQAKYIKVIDEKLNEEYVENIDDVNLKNIGNRRWKRSMKGCFFSKDNIAGRKRDQVELESLDLSADVITSLTTSLNKFLRLKIDAEVSDNEVEQMQLCPFNFDCSLFDKISNKIKDPELFERLKHSIKSFCCAVGLIGNRMPIPEFCNRHWGNDNYFHKINKLYIFYEIISIIKTNAYCEPDWKDMLSNNNNLENIIVDFYRNQLSNNIGLIDQSIPDYKKTKYENIWFYFFDSNEYKQFSDFIEDFCLQDYYKDVEYEDLITPCKKMDDSNPGFPSKEASIEDWRDWFNCNTCLILKRGARIYIEGCGEKDNEKKNKARKELAWKLIEKEFNLGTWYQNEGEELGLEVLV